MLLRLLARERSVGELVYRLYPHEEIRDELDLERHILAGSVAELIGLSGYLSGAQCEFYDTLVSRYPVQNLKVLLRLWGRQPDPRAADPYLLPLPAGWSLRAEEFLACESIEDFVGLIPLAQVREDAQAALPLFRETSRKAYVEMGFDRGYWRAVSDGLRAIHPAEQNRCSLPIRRELESLRLLATLRAARVYRIPWEHLERLLPASLGGVSTEELRGIYRRPEPEVIRDGVQWLKGMELADEVLEDAGLLEEALWREVVRLANRQYYTVLSGFCTLVSYYYLKRNEFRRLLGLMHMVRYGESEEEIAEHLGV
jgi:vacuolar-type H+-ATPase subunit C/Vma6